MAMEQSEIERLIKASMPDAEVEIIDLAGDNNHFSAHVTSSTFEGKSRIEQHKMVYDALGDKMGGILHALALKTSIKKD
jgi:stress-induced morphogen